MLCDDLEGWDREAQEGGDMGISYMYMYTYS